MRESSSKITLLRFIGSYELNKINKNERVFPYKTSVGWYGYNTYQKKGQPLLFFYVIDDRDYSRAIEVYYRDIVKQIQGKGKRLTHAIILKVDASRAQRGIGNYRNPDINNYFGNVLSGEEVDRYRNASRTQIQEAGLSYYDSSDIIKVYDIEEGIMKKENILSKEFLNNVMTEKDYNVIALLNAWSKFVKGKHSGNFYAGGQAVMYYDIDDELPKFLKPYIPFADYRAMVDQAKKKAATNDKMVEVHITLKEIEDILNKAGVKFIAESKFWDGNEEKFIELSDDEIASYYKATEDSYTGVEDFIRYHKLGKASAEKFKKSLSNLKQESILESFSQEDLDASIENGIGLNLLGREEKNKEGEDVFKSDEEYDMYIEMFLLNNIDDESEEDEDFAESTNEYISCIWDLFNHFLKNGQSDESIESFEQAEELTGFQAEIATDLYNAFYAKLTGDKEEFFNFKEESVIIESVMKKPRLREGDLDILRMLKSHGYHYLVRNSKGVLFAYHKEPYKRKGEEWAADQSMPYEFDMQYLFPFVKPSNRRPWHVDTLLQNEELQADTMSELDDTMSETTQASAIGSRVSYPQRNKRFKRGKK